MEFQCVAMPQTESELAVMVCTLDAYGISHYVHNNGFGGLYPGMQIGLYNVRRLMVRVDQTVEAGLLLNESLASPDDAEVRLTIADRFRVVVELLFLGWAFPMRLRRFEKQE